MLLRARRIEYDAALHRAGDREGDAAGDIGLHETRYDVSRGPLRGDYEMHTRGASHLSNAADALLHVLRGDEHEVRQLVHDYDDLRHGLRAQLLLVGVVAREVAHARLGKQAVAL